MDGISKRPSSDITVKDIAKKVGVSTSTVSRVLSGKGSEMIGEETRKRVFDAAAQMEYVPNPMARALKGKQTKLLGVIVREIADPFFASFIASLTTSARELGYQIVLGHANSDPETAIQISAILDTRHLDGVFAMGDLRDDNSALEQLLQYNRVVVAMCRGRKPGWIPKVNVDNFTGVRSMLDYLMGLGHRKIAFIDGTWLGDIRERRDAFEQYRSEHHLQEDFYCFAAQANNADGGYAAMREILTRSPRPTAVFASDDVTAIGAIKAATDAGLAVPGDISIAGFDDIQLGRFLTPALTTIRQPIEQMANLAMELMINLIEKKNLADADKSVLVQPELIIRDSTGTPPKI
jgi:DNA-binding LacI/PurR family transcriptional regulator